MILRKAGAALAAGCTMIVKPSPETPFSVLTLGYLALKAGFPPGVFNVLTTSLDNTPALSEALCRHELVKKVTFTGSTRVGKLVAKICADGLKKVTLELGGNCPFLIFEDADLEQAATGKSKTIFTSDLRRVQKYAYDYTGRLQRVKRLREMAIESKKFTISQW